MKRRESLIMCRKLALILENSTWFVKKWLQAIKEQENRVTLKKKKTVSFIHTHTHTPKVALEEKKMISGTFLKR